MAAKQQLKEFTDLLKKDANLNAKHIQYESFGKDTCKTKKNEEKCDRGRNSGPARYCSPHLRKIYPQHILGDAQRVEFCVNGRHNVPSCCTNDCSLCHIESNHYDETESINFAESICRALDGNNTDDMKRKSRLLSFINTYIISDYPKSGGEHTLLKITMNGKQWLVCYLKLAGHSSMTKTASPSGYKYKDRISFSKLIKIESKSNQNAVFYIKKDPNYTNSAFEARRPVINGIGFWGLGNDKEDIRHIIHLNAEQSINVNFGFYIKDWSNIQSIKVQLVTNRTCLGSDDEVLTLWQYNQSQKDEHHEITSYIPSSAPSPGNAHDIDLVNNQSTMPQIAMNPHHFDQHYQCEPFPVHYSPPSPNISSAASSSMSPPHSNEYQHAMHPSLTYHPPQYEPLPPSPIISSAASSSMSPPHSNEYQHAMHPSSAYHPHHQPQYEPMQHDHYEQQPEGYPNHIELPINEYNCYPTPIAEEDMYYIPPPTDFDTMSIMADSMADFGGYNASTAPTINSAASFRFNPMYNPHAFPCRI